LNFNFLSLLLLSEFYLSATIVYQLWYQSFRTSACHQNLFFFIMPRIDDVQQQFQQICDDLQAQINNQDARYSVQEAALEQVKGMLAELCT